MRNAFEIVREFEDEVAKYTGAPKCVSVNSCSNAIFLACKFNATQHPLIYIPKRTYVSVPMQIKHAGCDVQFIDEDWTGAYRLYPSNIWDSARRFTGDMFSHFTAYATGPSYVCVSFHWAKILGIQQGGAILHNDANFDAWARKARFDGREEGVAPKDQKWWDMGWHMYMSPEIAAEGLVRLMHLKANNPDLPNDDYPDLSQLELFKCK